MGNKTSYFRLGLFAFTAVFIAIISLAMIVGPDLFRTKSRLETYFKFSISGLEVGSPVKFRGIPVGQVDEILLSTEAYPQNNQEILSAKNSVAVVRMKVNLSGDEVKNQLKDYINNGLRIQTQLAGITGSLYLSIEFLDPEKYPADRIQFDWTPKYLYVPSAPSLSNEIVENVKEFLASLDSLDLKRNLETTIPVFESLIANLERIAKGLDPQSFNALGSSLSGLFENAEQKISQIDIQELNKLIDELNQSAQGIDNMAQRIEAGKLIKNLTNLSQNLNNMLRTNSYDLTATLKNLDSIAKNLKNLTAELPGNPAELFIPSSPSDSPFTPKP